MAAYCIVFFRAASYLQNDHCDKTSSGPEPRPAVDSNIHCRGDEFVDIGKDRVSLVAHRCHERITALYHFRGALRRYFNGISRHASFCHSLPFSFSPSISLIFQILNGPASWGRVLGMLLVTSLINKCKTCRNWRLFVVLVRNCSNSNFSPHFFHFEYNLKLIVV